MHQVAAEKAASPGSAGKIGWRKVTLSRLLPQPLSINLRPPASLCPVDGLDHAPIVHSPAEWSFWLGTMGRLCLNTSGKLPPLLFRTHPVNLGVAENGSLSGTGGGF